MNVQHSSRTGPTTFTGVVREPDPDDPDYASTHARPTVQLYDTATHSLTVFLTADEVDSLLAALGSIQADLHAAEARWVEEVARRSDLADVTA